MWNVSYRPELLKFVKKLDNKTQESIKNYIKKISDTKDPKVFGKPLSANLKGFWRYRVGDYRIICEIRKNELIILVIDIEHRSRVYKAK
jgi:mRNA interferase RelE/StbE